MTVISATNGRCSGGEPSEIEISPLVEFPPDPALAKLDLLLEPNWVWERLAGICSPLPPPQRLQIREFSHSPGRRAQVCYTLQWPEAAYLPERIFTIRLVPGHEPEAFEYRDDPDLPGLSEAADPEGALRLINEHVLAVPVRRATVELIRYRPGSRAVLRHRVGKSRFFARAVRSNAVSSLLQARQTASQTGFVVPRLAGRWDEGAVVWMSEIPGRNLRDRIRSGKAPPPDALLDGLEPLWGAVPEVEPTPAFELRRAYRRARRSIRQQASADESLSEAFDLATQTLDPFTKNWRPTTIAHNDFYDDQLLVLRDGRLALVDYEEAGSGDPMLDIGNFLAHLRWSAQFGNSRYSRHCDAYYDALSEAAESRYDWHKDEAALRVAVCLFRICTNVTRHPRADWSSQLSEGLDLVNQLLR